MKPAPFDFQTASSVDDAISTLHQAISQDLDVKVIAGGQSLVAMMNLRVARPQLLVDLNGLDELSFMSTADGALRVGSMTTQRSLELSDDVRNGWPLLSEALPYVAHVPIRSRGTLGGSLAHADPGAELCGVGLALDASVRVRGPNGEREVPLNEFFLGPFTTTLAADEVLVEVVFPAMEPQSGSAFEEVARRRGDFALAGVACQVTCNEEGRITRARLGYISVGPKPMRVPEAEDVLLGERPGGDLFEHAGEVAADAMDALEDIHASPEYRSHLARVLTRRVLTRAHSQALGTES